MGRAWRIVGVGLEINRILGRQLEGELVEVFDVVWAILGVTFGHLGG